MMELLLMILLISLVLALSVVISLWKAFVIVKLWTWFVTPVYTTFVPTVALVFGLLTIYGMITYKLTPDEDSDRSDEEKIEKLARSLGVGLVSPAVILLAAWLVKLIVS